MKDCWSEQRSAIDYRQPLPTDQRSFNPKGEIIMSSLRVFATLFITALCLTAPSFAQDGKGGKEASGAGNEVEVKTDRFSNITKVTLKPQTILDKPGHLVTMRIETKLEKKDSDDAFRDSVDAYAHFESQSNGSIDFGDGKILFLVNSRPLQTPEAEIETDGYTDPKPGFKVNKSGVTIFNRAALEQIAKANEIEMRLGSVELRLSASLVATMREYATQALAQQKAINGR
jgi:hypothetical protein